MTLHKFFHLFVSVVFLLLAGGCATVEKPSGGPIDITPAKMISANPGDSAVNFTSDHIILEFNEYVKLNNPNSQVIMNPFPKEKPVLTVQGKKVRIDLKDSLMANTTYHIFFGDAIQDITESRPSSGLSYVFSTGNHLDSCTIKGNAGDAFTGVFTEKAWVMLYGDLNAFTDTLPVYIAHTNKTGAFTFRNISPGKYYICALEDNNSNFKFDLPDEKIAFRNDAIEVSSSMATVDSVYLYLFVETPATQKHLKTEMIHYRSVRSSFRLPLKNPEITVLKGGEGAVYRWNEKKDSLVFWIKDKKADSLRYIIRDGLFSDTLSQALQQKTRQKNYATDTVIKLNVNVRNELLLPGQHLILSAPMPLVNWDTSKIILKINNDTVPAVLTKTDDLGCRWQLNVDLKEEDIAVLTLKKGAVTDFFGFHSDSTQWKFRPASSKDLGSIGITFSNRPAGSLYMNISSKDMQQTVTLHNDSTQITLPNLLPGDYSLQMVFDKNDDGEWTSGDFEKRNQPEKVFNVPKPVTVKRGWTSKLEWNLGE